MLEQGIYSITVTHNPKIGDGFLRKQLISLTDSGISPILVDNNSDNLCQIQLLVESVSPSIRIIKLNNNYGIAKALNTGITECLQNQSTRWILTLDQDTVINDNTIEEFNKLTAPGNNGMADIYGLNYFTIRFCRQRVINKKGKPYVTNFVITSGMFVRRVVYETLKFNDKLFMYFIDDDFCTRARKLGYTIVQCQDAMMMHKEGERLLKGDNLYYVMKPSSIFYVGRNSIYMFFQHGRIKPFLYAIQTLLENVIANYFVRDTLYSLARGLLAGIVQQISGDKSLSLSDPSHHRIGTP